MDLSKERECANDAVLLCFHLLNIKSFAEKREKKEKKMMEKVASMRDDHSTHGWRCAATDKAPPLITREPASTSPPRLKDRRCIPRCDIVVREVCRSLAPR